MNLDSNCLALYRFARSAFENGDVARAEKLYRKIRGDHACELFYEVELPPHVRLIHPLGSVLGRANYGDYFVSYHNVSVGSTIHGERPTLGTGVVLFPGAKVLGKAVIGDNVFVTANSLIQGSDVVPSNCVVFPLGSGIAWKPTERSVIETFFKEKTDGSTGNPGPEADQATA